ncbi:MAG: thioredoxin family protein, partial [Planctomycetia bacterium]|nr:thioredoxin family protein [Planctomycetia bacterium]
MRKEIGRLGCRWMRGCAVIAVILETCLVTQGALAERYAQRETQLQSAQITRSALVAQTTRVTQISQTPQSIQPVQSITTSKGKEGTQKYVLPGVDSDSPEMAGRNTLPVDLAMALDSATATGGRPLVIPGVEPKCHWFTEWNDALHASKGLNRPLLVHFSMEYCGPCKRMEETVFSEETIQMLAGSYFVLLKIDGNKNPTIRDRFGVKAFPSDFVVLPDGKILARHTGYQDRTK